MFSSFFLGANSGHGFHSFYKELINLKEATAVYILKGGPGSGKSSLMKKVAEASEEKGYEVERIYCSSDPDSLDAVIIPKLQKAIVDGTSPHVVEPEFPLAVERYINLGQFADYEEISKKKNDIIAVKEKYSKFFEHVYRLTASAAHIDNELFDIALGGISLEKLHNKARGIISREIRGKGNKKGTKHRFISAISPKGYSCLFTDNDIDFTRTFVIEDGFGLAHFLLVPILKAAEASGFECIACQNPLIPERLEHLIIPELSLAFLTSSKSTLYKGEYYRKIRLDAMLDTDVLKTKKHRISLLKKTREAILDAACETLREAKLVHDELENLYNPHIRFDELYKYADELIKDILE